MILRKWFYSHVNYSVTKIESGNRLITSPFYSHVNYSVTKIAINNRFIFKSFTVT